MNLFEMFVSFLGGSLTTGVVTALIQRNYQKKNEQREIYKSLRNRLCHYKDDIGDMLISFYKDTYLQCNLIDKRTNEINRKVNDTSHQIHVLSTQEECTSCENRNSDKCNFLASHICVIDKKIESIQKECNVIKQDLDNFENDYWQSNETIYNIVSKYKSLSNDLGLMKNKSISLIKMIGEIDKYTLQLISVIQQNKINGKDIVNHCIKLTEQISKAIMQLDKDNN